MQSVNKSTSFLQNQKHETKSNRFQAVKPEYIEEVLSNHGFDLVSLYTGQARKADRQDFQNTIARYRSRDNFAIEGLNFDLVFKVPHLYGALQGFLGMFRLVCKNGLVVGHNYKMITVKHLGNPIAELNALIPQLVAQRQQLISEVNAMQNRVLTRVELAQLSERVALARLGEQSKAISFDASTLLKVRRDADVAPTLFNALNIVQENIMHGALTYQINTTDKEGRLIVQSRRATSLLKNGRESVRSVEFNSQIWSIASEFLAA